MLTIQAISRVKKVMLLALLGTDELMDTSVDRFRWLCSSNVQSSSFIQQELIEVEPW